MVEHEVPAVKRPEHVAEEDGQHNGAPSAAHERHDFSGASSGTESIDANGWSYRRSQMPGRGRSRKEKMCASEPVGSCSIGIGHAIGTAPVEVALRAAARGRSRFSGQVKARG